MVHYVAEQITIAENTIGGEKTEAEKRCFQTILKLWNHRHTLPNGRRPLENFEPILRTLDRLDPENSQTFFYNTASNASDFEDEVREWTEIALGIDRGVRVLINFALSQAALNAADEKTLLWLSSAVDSTDNRDIMAIIHLLQENPDNQNEYQLSQAQQDYEEDIKSKIEILDTFMEFSSQLRATLASSIET